MRVTSLQKRVREIAKEFRSYQRISDRRSLELAREWVMNWEPMLPIKGLKEAAQRTNA